MDRGVERWEGRKGEKMNPGTNEVVRDMDQNLSDSERNAFFAIEEKLYNSAEEVLGEKDRVVATKKTEAGRRLIQWAEEKKRKLARDKRKRQRKARRKSRR
jgi:hypothetical protein